MDDIPFVRPVAMTAKPKPAADTPTAIAPDEAVVLRLAALGIDHRAGDFPERFSAFCEQNDRYEMEVTAEGELLILPMTGYRGNKQEFYFAVFLGNWELANGGSASSQTARFRLPSGAVLGPDAAWITQQRFDELPDRERETIIEGAPDFVVELRSRSDNLRPLQNKMAQWMAGGVRLGWLIDARQRQVHIYRANQPEPQLLENPESLDGEDVLPGFSFPARRYIFDL